MAIPSALAVTGFGSVTVVDDGMGSTWALVGAMMTGDGTGSCCGVVSMLILEAGEAAAARDVTGRTRRLIHSL